VSAPGVGDDLRYRYAGQHLSSADHNQGFGGERHSLVG